jgi:hypothetical protein
MQREEHFRKFRRVVANIHVLGCYTSHSESLAFKIHSLNNAIATNWPANEPLTTEMNAITGKFLHPRYYAADIADG